MTPGFCASHTGQGQLLSNVGGDTIKTKRLILSVIVVMMIATVISFACETCRDLFIVKTLDHDQQPPYGEFSYSVCLTNQPNTLLTVSVTVPDKAFRHVYLRKYVDGKSTLKLPIAAELTESGSRVTKFSLSPKESEGMKLEIWVESNSPSWSNIKYVICLSEYSAQSKKLKRLQQTDETQ